MTNLRKRFYKKRQHENSAVSLNRLFLLHNYTIWFLIILSVFMFLYLGIFISRSLVSKSIRDSNNLIHARLKTTLEQGESIAQYFSHSETLQNYLTCQDEFELIDRWKQVGILTEPFIRTNQDLYAIIVYRSSHRTPYFSNYPFPDNAPFYSIAPLFEEESTSFQGYEVIFSRYKNHPSYAVYAQPVISAYDNDSFGQFLGTAVVVLNPDFLDKIITLASPEGIISSISITDENGDLIAQTNPSDTNHNFLFPVQTLPVEGTSWSVTCYPDQLWIIQRYIGLLIMFFLFLFLILFMLLNIKRSLRKYLNQPIAALCNELTTMTHNQESLLSASSTQEINEIISSFNMLLTERQQTSAKMHQLEMEHYEAQISKKVSDLQYLISQINPHFLLNTLSCIGGIAALHEVNEIMEIISDLSDTIRYALYKSDIVTLRDEHQIIQKYFNIIRIRFRDAYTLETDVPEELLDCPMPKMILQPVIENALYHGLEPKASGHILLSIKAAENTLYITVSDNGVGMPADRVSSIQNVLDNSARLEYSTILEKKIGNVNVCRRIKLMYGEEYGMHLQSAPDAGTIVTLHFPITLPEKYTQYFSRLKESGETY